MLIHARSQISGKINSMDIAVTKRELDEWRTSGKLIQDSFPNLTADEREFLLTGATAKEWDSIFPEEEAE